MFTIFNLPVMENDAIAFFQKKGILKTERIRENGSYMQLYVEGEKISRDII